jgi:hypothetical protein
MSTPSDADRWHIEKTRELVCQQYGAAQLALVRPSIRSVFARMDHAQYHFREARAVLQQTIDERFDRQELYDAVLFVDPQGRQAIDNGLMKVEAHMMASAQAIHAVADTLAHVVYFALGLNFPQSWNERKVDLETIAKAVKGLQQGRPSYPTVSFALDTLRSNDSFKAVHAIVNHSKHRGIPEPVLALQDDNSDRLYDMQFGHFMYDDSYQPRTEMKELLEPAYAAVLRAVIDTGNAINEVLAREVAQT